MNNTPIEYKVTYLGIDRPSKALRAMIEGLKEADERPTFTVEMATFGRYKEKEDMCYGCAATATLMKLTGKERIVKELIPNGNPYVSYHPLFSIDKYYSPGFVLEGLDPDRDEFFSPFEFAIDSLRKGTTKYIFEFFKLEKEWSGLPSSIRYDLPELMDQDWKDNLHHYEKLADLLESRGL